MESSGCQPTKDVAPESFHRVSAASEPTSIGTVDLHMQILEPAHQEDLIAIGEPVRLGKRLAFVAMRVETESGRLVATGSATFSVSSLNLPKPDQDAPAIPS